MAIISTPSAENANSFVDLAFAEAFFSTKFGADAWDTFSTPNKEKLLVSATEAVNVYNFGGQKTVRTQALEWPRQFLTDPAGYALSSTDIPLNLKKAVCEMAYWIWTEEDRIMSDNEIRQLESMKVGPLDVKVSAKATVVPVQVEQLLQSIGPDALVGTSKKPTVTRMCL